MSPVVFLDTETTGLDPERHEVWEIAVIRDEVEHRWAIRPKRPADADPGAIRITRFYDRTADPKWHWDDPVAVAPLLAQLLAGQHIVAAVPSFDAPFLARFLLSYGQIGAWHYHLVDVEALAAGRLGIEPPWDSVELSKAVGVDPAQFEKHTALGDARWAKAIYEAVFDPGAVIRRPERTAVPA